MGRAWYFIIFIIIFAVIIVPSIIVSSYLQVQVQEPIVEKDTTKATQEKMITIYINSSKTTSKLPMDEYVRGVVAAEMPGNFNLEALKAQAVAARTYIYKRWQGAGGKGCGLHPEADVCDAPSHCQGWITKGEMLKKWGIFSYYHYYSKINQAVNSTKGMIIFYNDEPIDPLFFSTSNGKTENSEDVWEKPISYLRSVDSPGEEVAPRFFSQEEIPVNVFVSQIRQKWPDISIDDKNPEKQLKVIETSQGGRIKKLKVGNKEIKGTEFRELFNLKSTDFKWERIGDKVKITCNGFGHGVGMSQYGAEVMAKNGAGYIDIIKHYYSDVDIRQID